MSNIKYSAFFNFVLNLSVVFVYMVGANHLLHLVGWFQSNSIIDFVFRSSNILVAIHYMCSLTKILEDFKKLIGLKSHNKFLNKWFHLD